MQPVHTWGLTRIVNIMYNFLRLLRFDLWGGRKLLRFHSDTTCCTSCKYPWHVPLPRGLSENNTTSSSSTLGGSFPLVKNDTFCDSSLECEVANPQRSRSKGTVTYKYQLQSEYVRDPSQTIAASNGHCQVYVEGNTQSYNRHGCWRKETPETSRSRERERNTDTHAYTYTWRTFQHIF